MQHMVFLPNRDTEVKTHEQHAEKYLRNIYSVSLAISFLVEKKEVFRQQR